MRTLARWCGNIPASCLQCSVMPVIILSLLPSAFTTNAVGP